ncbi:MAG: UDP-2,3-diacylglucosamine diphosphatase [Planctomycetota bacterium]|nr:UDP-2,3-diacylglucosamine diphosphatase [Planctomycetota bacterium]
MPPTAPQAPAQDGEPVARGILRVFLADLHLDGTDSPRARTFRALLERLAEQAAVDAVNLYLLGDLFEFWEEYHRQAREPYESDLQALEAAHRAGVKIHLFSGNRDFAYGRYVRERLGAELGGDGMRIELSDARKVWLEHGDLLCTGDTRYLRYRRWVRSWPVRLLYRLLPWSLARRFVGNVKARSAQDKAKKARQVFEVDEAAARRRMEVHDCRLLMCGHTHRPLASDLGNGFRLVVLPAWCEVTSGYRERVGALQPVFIEPDGTPRPARTDGTPADG